MRTKDANVDDSGHPWLTPSCMEIDFHSSVFHLKCTSAGSSYMSVVSGISSGKCLLMMSNSSSRETLLNILVRSMKAAARDGIFDWFCGAMINLSMESCIDLMMKSMPPLIPTAQLKGRRCSPNLSLRVMAMCEARMRRMAVGIPIGRSFDRFVGSLWRQKR